jgi:hypothetical protein
MPARCVHLCALLFIGLRSLSQCTIATASDAEDKVLAITWMQVSSASRYAVAPDHNFVPLNVIRWSVSATNRLRIEEGDSVFITDCHTGESLQINLQAKSARRQQEDRKPDIYQKLKRPLLERGLHIQGQDRRLGRSAIICSWPEDTHSLIWCDRDTGEMLYGEAWHRVNGQQRAIANVCFNYDSNVSLDRNLFSLEPPPGFRLIP